MKSGLKKIGLLMTGLLVAFSLSACGGNSESAGSDNITLTLWHTWTEDRPENTVFKNKVEKFNQDHSDIQIKLVGIPNNDIETKLRTQASADELPDMFKGYPGKRMLPFIEADKVMPIDDIMDNWKGKIPKGLLKDAKFNGKQYAVPANVSETSLVFYRKSKLKEVGYDQIPKTYEDFKTMVKKLNDAEITPIALGNKAPWVLQSCYFSSIADRFTGSDFLPNALNDNAKFTDDQFVNSLSVIQELDDLQAFNEDFNTIDEARSRSYFVQGDTAMHIAGSWAIGPILEGVSDKDDIGVGVFPGVASGDGDPSQTSGVIGGLIYANSSLSDEKKEAAKTFLKYFYDDELYQNLAKASLLVPVDVDAEGLTDLFKEANDIANNGLTPVYDATLSPKLTDVINNGLQSITTGSMTPEKLGKKMQQTLEDQ